MIRLKWIRREDRNAYGSVIGDPESIRDLYWQLTHNYNPIDGTAIYDVSVYGLDGVKYKYSEIMQQPYVMSSTSNGLD